LSIFVLKLKRKDLLSKSEDDNRKYEKEHNPAHTDEVTVPHCGPGEIEAAYEDVTEGLHWQRLWHHVAKVA